MSMTAATENPFHGITRQMGRFMDQIQKGYYNFAPGEVWTPNVNLYESDTSYLVCVDLAGIEKQTIDITVHEHVLKLLGRRAVPTPAREGDDPPPRLRVHMMEIDHGSFSREVELPVDVSHDKISANHNNGLLWIELPKK